MKPDDWSNVAYVIAGLALAVQGAYIPALGLIILGAASYVAHVRGGEWWYFDWAGMYLAMLAIVMHNIGYPLVFLILALPIVYLTLKHRFASYILTGTLFCAMAVSAHVAELPVTIPVTLFAIALAVRQLGQRREYQLYHSAWHVLTSIGFYLLTSLAHRAGLFAILGK